MVFAADGRPATVAGIAAQLSDTDFIAFGELHHHVVGSRYELELLAALAEQDRPIALAMEFFEAHTQADLDAYLAGQIDQAELVERTERDEHYAASHGPLIELCRDKGIPVIAANAPRRLVTAYRKAGDVPYDEWLATLSEEDRAFMPRQTELPADEFRERFMKLMGPKRGPAFFKSMALWNDAMAESAAEFREAHPEHRVMLVVGGFHVAHHLGTITQYEKRRPDDDVAVVLMQAVEKGPLGFGPEDEGEGDFILEVRP